MSETAEKPKQAAKKMRIHLLIEMPTGPIRSGKVKGPLPLGSDSQWAIACDPNLLMDGELNRGTGEPWAVACDACRATAAFKAIDRPKPGTRSADDALTADGSDGCC